PGEAAETSPRLVEGRVYRAGRDDRLGPAGAASPRDREPPRVAERHRLLRRPRANEPRQSPRGRTEVGASPLVARRGPGPERMRGRTASRAHVTAGINPHGTAARGLWHEGPEEGSQGLARRASPRPQRRARTPREVMR